MRMRFSSQSSLCANLREYAARKCILLPFFLLPAALLLFTACSRPAQTAAPSVAQTVAPASAKFVGNAACKACHAEEFREHAASRHAHTLRLMNRQSLGKQAPPTGQIANTPYALIPVGNEYGFGRMGSQGGVLTLAFGSGKSGMAFTMVMDENTMAEARMSYFPPRKEWYVTPGQQDLPEGAPGNITRGPSARQCVQCHVVTLPENSIMPEKQFLGVGCEACHGAGGDHIAAMQAGKTSNLYMERMADWGGAKVNQLCGRCHRTEQDVALKNLSRQHTDLFQGYGLAQSRCFRESGDRLSCLTCHNPHANVNPNAEAYTAACLKCHAPASSAASRLMTAKTCPVNAVSRCVECHMPKRAEPVFPGSPRRVADHFIRAYRKTEPSNSLPSS